MSDPLDHAKRRAQAAAMRLASAVNAKLAEGGAWAEARCVGESGDYRVYLSLEVPDAASLAEIVDEVR